MIHILFEKIREGVSDEHRKFWTVNRKEIKCYNFILLKNIFLEIIIRKIIFIHVESIILNVLKTKLNNISLNNLFKYNSTIKKQEN